MTIRWGLIGAGDIANKRVASAIQNDPNSDLVAVCRRSKRDLHEFADRFSIANRYTDVKQLLSLKELDAVYIATPVDCHCPQTIAAAQAGRHVLVEKPMALDPDQCQEMIDTCERVGVLLGVAYYRRFYPIVARIQSLIESGRLGRVLSIACVTGNTNRFKSDDWRVIRECGGGGPLMDIGSHRLDLFLHLMGDVESVKASFVPSPDYQAEQAATLLVQFNSGVQGVLQCYFGTVNTPDRLEIIGTDGRITVDDLNGNEMLLVTANGPTHESHPPASNLHAPLVEDFSASLVHGGLPTISGPIGKHTSELIHLAYHDALRIF